MGYKKQDVAESYDRRRSTGTGHAIEHEEVNRIKDISISECKQYLSEYLWEAVKILK